MSDRSQLLHNMSAPPKTVVKYSGLGQIRDSAAAGAPGTNGGAKSGATIFGTPARFVIPPKLTGESHAAIMRDLGLGTVSDPERRLIDLVNDRADELPLPDGCAVIPTLESYRIVWSDVLSTLAILAKCSDTIWLRDKNPAFNAAFLRRQATLLVPPRFASRLPEV
jgi:hypothetical protein